MDLYVDARLFGGHGDGMVIRVQELLPTITVFRNGGPPFSVPGKVEASAEPDAICFGAYDLVGRQGPDVPTYVATRTL
jgi:hypothetical protein